jgi:hypothetical protein
MFHIISLKTYTQSFFLLRTRRVLFSCITLIQTKVALLSILPWVEVFHRKHAALSRAWHKLLYYVRDMMRQSLNGLSIILVRSRVLRSDIK